MFEALVAVALMGLVVGALARVTAQWLPNWNRGVAQAQRNEQLAIALDRLAADLSAAEFVMPNQQNNVPLFQGDESSVTFVRSTLGPNNRSGLEIVRIAEVVDDNGRALVRMRAPFILLQGNPTRDSIPFADPVVLLRAPFRVNFSYNDPRGIWMSSWRNSVLLPAAVRFDVRDDDRRLLLSTATRIRAELAAPVNASAEAPAAQPNAQGAR